MSSTVQFVYVTFPDQETAARIAHRLLEEGLIACANVLNESKSFYRWEGEVRSDTEVIAIFKTTSERYIQLEQRLVTEHPYDTPCIVSWDITQGHPSFLNWVEKEVEG